MGKLIRYSNPDGTVTFKDSVTGKIIDPKAKTQTLSGWLSSLGIIYFIVSVIISIVLFANSTLKIKSIVGEVSRTNPIIISVGIIAIFQGILIMLICLAISRILDHISE